MRSEELEVVAANVVSLSYLHLLCKVEPVIDYNFSRFTFREGDIIQAEFALSVVELISSSRLVRFRASVTRRL